MQSESGHPILLVAGMDPRDTQAAVEFLSNDRYLEPVVKSMPADWANKKFQVVLHNTIHGNSAGSLSVDGIVQHHLETLVCPVSRHRFHDRYLEPVVKSMPADWANKSFQVVLHNTIHAERAG